MQLAVVGGEIDFLIGRIRIVQLIIDCGVRHLAEGLGDLVGIRGEGGVADVNQNFTFGGVRSGRAVGVRLEDKGDVLGAVFGGSLDGQLAVVRDKAVQVQVDTGAAAGVRGLGHDFIVGGVARSAGGIYLAGRRCTSLQLDPLRPVSIEVGCLSGGIGFAA